VRISLGVGPEREIIQSGIGTWRAYKTGRVATTAWKNDARLTGGDHAEHARFRLLSRGVGSAASDRAVIVVRAAAAAAAVHRRDRGAVREHRGQPADAFVCDARVSGLAARSRVLHHLVAAHLGRRRAARPVERPLEHVRRRVRVHLAHDLRVLVPGHAVRQLLVVLAHGFVCEQS